MPPAFHSAKFAAKQSFSPRALGHAQLCLLVTLVTISGGAHAQQSNVMDRLNISAGAFHTEPELAFDASTPYGTVSTPKEKLSNLTMPRVKANILLGNTQGISADYFRFKKNYSDTLSASRQIEGIPYAGTVTASATVQLDMAQVAYQWWLGNENTAFGLGAGAGYYRIKLGGEASGFVQSGVGDGQQTRVFDESGSTNESAFAPLVKFGMRHAISPDLRLIAEISGVKKNGGRLEGKIYQGSVGVEWFFAKNIGLTAEYGLQRIDLQRNGSSMANLDLRMAGPSAYISARF